MLKSIVKYVTDYSNLFQSILAKKDGTLVYLGLNKGRNFSTIFRKYEKCYAFEADPSLYIKLKKRFRKFPNVHIYNVAVADYDGEIEFNISNNRASSSIGKFSKDWNNHKSGAVKMIDTIKVPCINLCSFLQKQNIDYIDDYISDIQGFDLAALRTLKPYIDQKKIKNITSEVTKNEYRNIYSDLPDNSEQGFTSLLAENYKLVAKGWGVLRDGKYDQVPGTWWEMDCKWTIK